MKILSLEVNTDMGRRVIQLGVPVEIDPQGEMHPTFRALTELAWKVLCDVAQNAQAYTPPKAEA